MYYANYLKYFERARTEYLLSHGISVAELQQQGIYFLVTHAEVFYRSAAHYGETLHVDTVASASRKNRRHLLPHDSRSNQPTPDRRRISHPRHGRRQGKSHQETTSVAVDVPVAHSSVAAPSHGVGCPLVCLRRRAILSRPLFPPVIPDLIGDPVICLFFCHQAIPVRRQGHASCRFSPSPSGRGQG